MAINRKCLDCNCDISDRHGNAVRCKKCSKIRRNELKTKWYLKNIYYKKRKLILYKRNLGTGELKEHRNKNFDEEHRLIQKEKKRLGLIK